MPSVRDFCLTILIFCLLAVSILAFEEWKKYLRARFRAEVRDDSTRWRKAARRRTRIGLYISFGWLLFFCALSFYSGFPDEPNKWGDWAAGAFAPVAFGWLVLGYFQQGEELRMQANELRASVQQQSALSQSARDQVKQLEGANRPWVDFAAELQSVDLGADRTRVSLLLKLDNAGNSPAHHIQISSRLFFNDVVPAVTIESEVDIVRAEAEAKKDDGRGTTLLPGRKRDLSVQFEMPAVLLEAALPVLPGNRLQRMHIALCMQYKFASAGYGWTEKVIYIQGIDPELGVPEPIDHTQEQQDLSRLDLRESPDSRGLT